jgi:hypothetical protein
MACLGPTSAAARTGYGRTSCGPPASLLVTNNRIVCHIRHRLSWFSLRTGSDCGTGWCAQTSTSPNHRLDVPAEHVSGSPHETESTRGPHHGAAGIPARSGAARTLLPAPNHRRCPIETRGRLLSVRQGGRTHWTDGGNPLTIPLCEPGKEYRWPPEQRPTEKWRRGMRDRAVP